MNILLVSQCSKKALVETRRIVDQFAERKGDGVWLTSITQQGLKTLRKMLRKTARRNTAIACHWIKSNGQTEILWIVGNLQKFNENGSVPTNSTRRNILKSGDENAWNTAEDILLLSGIAGLFHDFGKANELFQKKLKPNHKGVLSEPYRHEWVSLRMFQAFVHDLSDEEWLQKLLNVSADDEKRVCDNLIRDGLDEKAVNPFKALQEPLAKTVGWLILTHHRLPKWFKKNEDLQPPKIKYIDDWLIRKKFDSTWNSQRDGDRESADRIKKVWEFPHGTPLQSEAWKNKAKKLATRALKRPGLLRDWLGTDPFSLHVSRMVLMLADHIYSAKEANPRWQDKRYRAFANSDRKTKKLKQKLDEHLVGVGINSILLAKSLPSLRQSLPAITRHKGFKSRSKEEKFRWQDKAYELAWSLKEQSLKQGFFGVNMASTGFGKTFSNGRIMYGLADEKKGCRFSVGLGLRTLTLQTGDALRDRLKLDEDDLAVLIGSQSVSQLHEMNRELPEVQGSESSENLFEKDQHIRYEGALDDGRLSKWLAEKPKLNQLVSAPILVSTIDHLIPATEGERGGKQIAPMLRLLTSDLVLDEPDDFNLEDLPALSRLVNWAGMLGSRVLISSATLPPALVKALFDAYTSGRESYQKACGEPGRVTNVCCAWFDEYGVAHSNHKDLNSFSEAHDEFVKERISNLENIEPVRKAEILNVEVSEPTPGAAIEAIAGVARTAMHRLHNEHGTNHPKSGKRISVGLIRMANINPLVAVAKQLLQLSPQKDHHIHVCVYHSQHPLAIRSEIEKLLDSVLTRHEPENIWNEPGIQNALNQHSETNHIFVVLATAVAEVGRDHDYDWAIAEPSSMRSLIQLAGRIQRHRNLIHETPNLLILSKNYNGLRGKEIAFAMPGFESEQFKLSSKNMDDLLESDQIKTISSIPRIAERSTPVPDKNLADLEHTVLQATLFGSQQPEVNQHASLWWKHSTHETFELQRRTQFRKSGPQKEYSLYIEEEGETPEFWGYHKNGEFKKCQSKFEKQADIEPASGVSFWGEYDFVQIVERLADSMEMDIVEASRKFGQLRLRDTKKWLYHRALGAYYEPKNN